MKKFYSGLLPKKAYIFVLGILTSIGLNAQTTYSTNAQCQVNYGDNLTFTINNLPSSCSGGTLTIYYRGDHSFASEYYTITDEVGVNVGQTVATSDCSNTFDSYDISIADTTLSRWLSDGSVKFTLDPSAAMNFCGASDNCAYVELTYKPQYTGLNASVASVDSPAVFCGGTQDIHVTIANNGTVDMDSVRVFWEIDGTRQSTYKHISSLNACDTARLKLGSFSFTKGVDMKVWTAFPNGTSDVRNADDTLSTTLSPSLSGTYTIGGTNADYADVIAAVDDLKKFGVCGPTEFRIASGTYSGKIVIPEIAGASDSNTIVFDGQDSSQTTITHSGGGGNYATIHMDGADHITFRRLTLETSASTDGWVVHFQNGAEHNVFENNLVEMSPTGSFDLIGFVSSDDGNSEFSSGNNGNYNTIRNSIITGGEKGIHLEGDQSNPNSGNKIYNNEFTRADDYGIYMDDQDSIEIVGNLIHNLRSSFADGIYAFDVESPFINFNEIYAPDWAVYLNDVNFNGAGRASVSNNIIESSGDEGFYLNDGDNVDILHNTIVGEPAIHFDDYSGMDCRNNIFIGNGDYAFECDQSSGFSNLDFNIYNSNTTPIDYDNTDYNTLADWQQAVPAFNQNSLDDAVNFRNANSLRLSNTVASPRGTYVGIDFDIDGQSRCRFSPQIGADESEFQEPAPSAAIGAPDTAYINSPSVLQSNYTGPTASFEWYVNDTLRSTSREFNLLRGITGTIDVKYIIETCGGKDSSTTSIVVVKPTTPPNADFIADRNEILLNESVLLSDLSTNGPTGWEYSVSPDSVFDPLSGFNVSTYSFSGTGANRTLTLFFAGSYDVQLVAENNAGTDTIEKSDYVTVKETAIMCTGDNSSDVISGILYDDGGPTANYSSGLNGNNVCTYTIEPCAENMFITFGEFSLSGGDYLRIYSGNSNQGDPLWDENNYPNGLTGETSNSNFPDTLFSLEAPIFIEFETSNFGTNDGFQLNWGGEAANFAAPTAAFTIPDTICIDQDVQLFSNSTGRNIEHSWTIGFNNFLVENPTINLGTAGTYTVELEVSNCGGTDVISQNIVAVSSSTQPVFNIGASTRNPAVGDFVTLYTESEDCNYGWDWEFSPSANVQFVNGTDTNSQSPQIQVLDTGCVDVIVEVFNKLGSTVDTFPCYLDVNDYCLPSVVSTSTDMGISKVTLGSINNSSDAGEARYTNYVNEFSTSLNKGGTYTLTVTRRTTVNSATRAAWIDFNQDGDFTDAGELIGSESKGNSKTWNASFSIPKTAIEGGTRMRVAMTNVGASSIPCGQAKVGEYEDYRVIISPDLIAPVITLVGADTLELEKGYNYVEPGYAAVDNVDGVLTSSVNVTNNVDNLTEGLYSISYSVSDSSNNFTEVERYVRVTPDQTAPDLALVGSLVDTLEVFATYSDPGITANDLVDGGNITTSSNRNELDTSKLGEHTITYSSTDQSGNTATIERTILIVDTQNPVISINGNAIDTVRVFDVFVDAGVTVTDNYWMNLEASSASNVDTRVLGEYEVRYSVSDSSGNGPVTATRLVRVVDLVAPDASLIGAEVMTQEVNTQFVDLGVSASDNYYNSVNVNRGGSFYTSFSDGFANDTGAFSIEYTIEDGSGNQTVLTRTVNVVDSEAPSITLEGTPIAKVRRWEDYSDAGYTLSDNFYANSAVTVDTLTDFENTQSEGVFYIQYRATDPSGNTQTSMTRTIYVGPNSVNEFSENVESLEVFPNPARSIANFRLDLNKAEQIDVKVYNMQGQLVETVYQGQTHRLSRSININNFADGTYIIRISGESFTQQKRLEVIK